MTQLRNSTDQPTCAHRIKSLVSALMALHCTPLPTVRHHSTGTANHPTGTMQSAEARFNKNNLLLTLRRYSSAVSDMEQTILLPSLLRDVPSDEVWDSEAAEETCRDLYSNYLMLKAIRNTVESSLVFLDDHKTKNNTVINKTLEPLLDTDPKALFHFHLSGLFSVMNNLTKKTQNLTEKYMDIIGVAN